MPWYRIEFRYGPGHMSKTVKWEWSDEPLDEAARRGMWDSMTEEWWTWPQGEVELVDRLPREVAEEKLQEYHSIKRHCERMIDILLENK